MKIKISLLVVALSSFLFTLAVVAQEAADHPSTKKAIASLEKNIPVLMKDANIPGMTAALIRNGILVWHQNFGVQNADTREPVTDETIFEAASLTKVVTSYAVLKLVDQGKIDLDTPLNKYIGNNYDVRDDDRINQITARRVMTHSSGFPNWRPEGSDRLPINFTPGDKFSYSGEGFVYLSKVVEHITHLKFEDFVNETVFKPLGMKNSSLVWLDSYAKRKIYRHDWLGNVSFRWEGKDANAAASLHTTATDYATFIIALLNGKGLKKATWNQMFTPQIQVDKNSWPETSWGLGVGLETTGKERYFWHWGDQGDSKCYMTAWINKKDALVYFTNSNNGLSFVREILDDAIGGKHQAPDWLHYDKYDPAQTKLYQSVIEKGSPVALKDYRDQRNKNGGKGLSESQINTIGYKLLQVKKIDEALEMFQQNTVDFPESANTWDSLAEAYMTKGDKESAIKYYEKSLKLNADNQNAIDQLKKLRS